VAKGVYRSRSEPRTSLFPLCKTPLSDHWTNEFDPQKKRDRGELVVYVDRHNERWNARVTRVDFDHGRQQLVYGVQILDGPIFERVDGRILEDSRPPPQQQQIQAAPQNGSGSGPRPGRQPDPEPETRKSSSIRRAVDAVRRFSCFSSFSHLSHL